MIDPARCLFYFPPYRKAEKRDFLIRLGRAVGRWTTDPAALRRLRADELPIVGHYRELVDTIRGWQRTGRAFIYRDNGYFRRHNSRWLPAGAGHGYYRWHVNRFQLGAVQAVPGDRWRALGLEPLPWRRGGRHIVIAPPTPKYIRFHGIDGWLDRTRAALAAHTDRPVVVRMKRTDRPLQRDLAGAHALVTHGSIAAVEAVYLGCPVFVDESSAAGAVGCTDLSRIEAPVFPDRQPWFDALAYAQFSEAEMLRGEMWRHLALPAAMAA